MQAQHLTLRLVRLKSPEEWRHQPDGLSFVFPKGGAGKAIVGQLSQRLKAGDVLLLNEGANGRICLVNGEEISFWFFSLALEHLFPLFAGNEISLLQNVFDGLK